MKRTLYFVFLLMLVCVFALSACNTNPPSSMPEDDDSSVQGTKQVPIYQGMTITDSNTSTLSLTSDSYHGAGIMLLSSNNANNGNNGNHYGHHKGDCADDRDDFNKNDPYPDNNEKIEDEIRDSLNVIGSSKEIYYATTNQDIYINIHISNPDKYEILSFTLNGEKYSSYMFEQGSTLETLILKVNVGNTSGIVEYTIDQIKYVDGTEIKDVKIDGEKTVMAGIKTENQVSGIVSNVNIGTNNISFDAKITDKDSLIAYSKGAIKAVLYDGEELIATKDIFVGENDIVFDALKTNSVYQYAIVAFYDDLSGNGVETHILSKEAFYTNAVVLFDNIAVGKVNTTFEFKWDESVANKALTSLKLYQGETLVRELAVNATSIDGLLSGSGYSLIAEYQNLGKTESIKLEFTTLMKEAYIVSITNPTQTQTSVGFEISETDADNVGSIIKIELYKDGQLVKEADSLDVRSFDGLLSNNIYTVKITYTYNLNDGAGDQTAEKTLDIKTDAKATPVVSITNPTQTQTSVGFEISETDADNVGSVTKIELYKDGQLVKETESLDARSFDGLTSATKYTVQITITYDLNDGCGNQKYSVKRDIATNAKEIQIQNVQILGDKAVTMGGSISLIIEVSNPDNVEIDAFVINDVSVAVRKATANTYVGNYVSKSTGGRESLVCNEIIYGLFEETVEQKTEFTAAESMIVLGTVSIESISVEKDYYYTGSTVKVVVDFKGSEGYEMKSVNVNITHGNTDFPLVKISDTSYYFVAPSNAYCIIKVLAATYGLGDSTTTSSMESDTIAYGCGSNYGDVIDISTPEQLQNMEDGKSYRLVNDIDLKSFEWTPYAFVGQLDGNGFVIKNFTISRNYTEKQSTEYYIGLFTEGGGYFTNLKLENCKITITSKYQLNLLVGFLVGHTFRDSVYFNCDVDGDISVIIQNGGWEACRIGGLAGWGDGSCFNNCSFKGTVSQTIVTNDEHAGASLGGICGFRGDIANCVSYSNAGAGGQTGIYNSYFYKLEEYNK